MKSPEGQPYIPSDEEQATIEHYAGLRADNMSGSLSDKEFTDIARNVPEHLKAMIIDRTGEIQNERKQTHTSENLADIEANSEAIDKLARLRADNMLGKVTDAEFIAAVTNTPEHWKSEIIIRSNQLLQPANK